MHSIINHLGTGANVMQTKHFIGTSLIVAGLCMSGATSAETLTIIIEDIREAKGSVQIQVLAGQSQFDGDGALIQFREEAVAGSMTFTASDLDHGEYAIRVMHDVNGNDELDTNLVGIPTEPYGVSNNAKGHFGPPRWADVRFQLTSDVTQVIKLNH